MRLITAECLRAGDEVLVRDRALTVVSVSQLAGLVAVVGHGPDAEVLVDYDGNESVVDELVVLDASELVAFSVGVDDGAGR